MPEIVSLTTPITKPNQTQVRIERVILDVEIKSIFIQFLGNNGEAGSAFYPTPAILNPLGDLQPTGAVLLSTLNTANLTSNSLVRRIINRLQTDGYIGAGSITGTPD